MGKTRNRGWRRFQQNRVFKARMQKFSSWGYTIYDEAGNRINNAHWFEIANSAGPRSTRIAALPVVAGCVVVKSTIV